MSWRARPTAISAADIIDAVEGPVALTECATHPRLRPREQLSRTGSSWQRVNGAIRRSLVRRLAHAAVIGQEAAGDLAPRRSSTAVRNPARPRALAGS
jgi:DNA-binding IscR family transcriptional regulator